MNYRYDSFEVSFTHSTSDEGDLTDINGFGIPIELSVGYGTGVTPTSTATRGYNLSGGAVTGGGIWTELASAGGPVSIQSYTGPAPLAGQPRMAISPAAAVGNNVPGTNYSTGQWDGYISSLHTGATSSATTPSGAGQIQIAGYFNGAKDGNHVWHNGGFYAYDVTFDGTTNKFVLKPGQTSQVKGDIIISPTDLANSIYLTLGNATVTGIANPNGIGNNSTLTINTGANNEWGTVLRDFIGGFTAGYWNSTATSVNPQVLGSINLNKEWDQDGTYSFGGSIPTGAGSITPATSGFYDPYAKVFFRNTNSYGTGYSDFAARGATAGPLINVTDGTTSGDPSNFIKLTLFADTDQPTGYTPQTINNYIPPGGGYLAANHINSSPTAPGHQLTFGVGTMALDSDTPVTIILKGAGTSGADLRVPLYYNGLSGGYAASGSHGAAYTISSIVGGGYSAGSASFENAGIVSISNLPVHSGSAGVMWYQIEVGSGAVQKTFDLYETVDATGQILNPAYAGQSSALAIDGIAAAVGVFGAGTTVSQQQYISGIGSLVQIGFQNGGTNTLDPSLMAVVPLASAALPNAAYPVTSAPLVGLRPGYTTSGGAPFLETYQAWAPPSSAQVYNGGLVFGWTGADNAAVQQRIAAGSSFVSALTNKIGAGNVARLVFTAVGGSLPTSGLSSSGTGGSTIYYTTATADSDGVWATSAPVSFGSGTYTVQMQEFLPTDTGFASALNSASDVQSFTVVSGATVNNGHNLIVSASQTSNGLTIDSGGTLAVLSGGTATGTLISAGGSAHTVAGNGDSGAIVLGYHGVWSGATAGNTTVASGGGDYVYGATTGASVNGGGVQVVGGGGGATSATATGTLVNSGSHQHVKNAGTASGTFVFSGGVLAVDSGGIATNMSAYAGGVVHVSSGGTLVGGSMYGATLDVFSGGSATGVTLNNGNGLVRVWAGGATDPSVTLNIGNQMYIYSGASAAATANTGAKILVSSGGSAGPGTTANHFGEIWVSSGGWAQPTLNGGRLNALAGATVNIATVNSGIEDVGGIGAITTGSFIHSGAYEYVHGGASAMGTTLSAAGNQWVWGAGTTATSTGIQSGASQNVYAGASAVGTQVSSGGRLVSWDSGTIVSGAPVGAGGDFYVQISATASNTQVNSGGVMLVDHNAVANGVELDGGHVRFNNGGQGNVQINATSSVVEVGNTAGAVAVSGFTVSSGTIDFYDIHYDASVTSSWTSTGAGVGTLTLTSGALNATVTLFGSFMAASDFTVAAFPGGTRVTDTMPGTDIQNLLTLPHG
ncbi:MAG: hypothetical protein AAB654_05940 [Acidobacteriota bacterium]|mgnify:CR=1 FL=1